MQIQPRQQILGIWRATARVPLGDDEWFLGGGAGSNSISDAERLLLYDRELLNGTTPRAGTLRDELDRIGTELQRARKVRRERPGAAVALTQEVLRGLDRLSAARHADSGVS